MMVVLSRARKVLADCRFHLHGEIHLNAPTSHWHLRIWLSSASVALLFLVLGVPCADSTSVPSTVTRWTEAALQGVRDAKLGAPVVSRALAIVHTCMYDAWAAYDERAVGTQLQGALRRPGVGRDGGE
jgi:hypothetical protein